MKPLHGLYAIITLMIRQRERDESKPVEPDLFTQMMLVVLWTIVTMCYRVVMK